MKNNIISFLFFCFLFLCNNLLLYGQQKTIPRDLNSRYDFYKESKESNLAINDTLAAIDNLRYIASIENKLGSPYDSRKTIVEAISLLDKLERADTLIEKKIGLLNHLGIIHRTLGEYNLALKNYETALSIAQNKKHINSIINNRAIVYKEQKNYALALIDIEAVFNNNLIYNDSLKIARSLDNMGFIQSKLSHPDGLNNMMKALNIRERENYKEGIYTSYDHLVDYYLGIGNLVQASKYADKGYLLAKEIDKLPYIEDALENVVDLSADERIRNYKFLKDSIEKVNSINTNKFALKKYNYEKQEQRAIIAELDLNRSELKAERRKRMSIFYASLGIVILLASVFLYFILKSKYKRDKIKEVYLAEAKISKKVHDDVANNVFHVMTKLLSKKEVDEVTIDDLEKIYHKTRDISNEYSILEYEGGFQDVLNDLVLSFKTPETNIVVRNTSEIDWSSVSKIKKQTIYKVLQELLINMKKHSQASITLITFIKNRNKINITYKDNGKGSELKKNTGLQNVENRILSLNGSIIFETSPKKGFNAKITI